MFYNHILFFVTFWYLLYLKIDPLSKCNGDRFNVNRQVKVFISVFPVVHTVFVNNSSVDIIFQCIDMLAECSDLWLLCAD